MIVVLFFITLGLILSLCVIVGRWYFLTTPKARQIFLGCLLFGSVAVNLEMARRYFLSISFTGGGRDIWSPDQSFLARAMSYQPIFGNGPDYYTFSIESENKPIKTIRIDSNERNGPNYFRDRSQLIQWSQDSKEATFDIPGMQVKMDVRLHSEEEERKNRE